jgi:hypothetical protein
MTQPEALEEARRRWGMDAVAEFTIIHPHAYVGSHRIAVFATYKGNGETFEEAFANADGDGIDV